MAILNSYHAFRTDVDDENNDCELYNIASASYHQRILDYVAWI